MYMLVIYNFFILFKQSVLYNKCNCLQEGFYGKPDQRTTNWRNSWIEASAVDCISFSFESFSGLPGIGLVMFLVRLFGLSKVSCYSNNVIVIGFDSS